MVVGDFNHESKFNTSIGKKDGPHSEKEKRERERDPSFNDAFQKIFFFFFSLLIFVRLSTSTKKSMTDL